MNEPKEFEFTAPEAVNVSVGQIRSLPDKLLLTVWTNNQQLLCIAHRRRFYGSCGWRAIN